MRDTLNSRYLQLGGAILANLSKLPPEVVDWYLSGKNQIPAALTRGFQIINSCINLLGADHVITADQAAAVWGIKIPEKPPMHYTALDLQWASRKNHKKKDDWYLVYCHGLSLLKQHELKNELKISKPFLPQFHPNISEFPLPNNIRDKWLEDAIPSGYYLFNFVGIIANYTWYKQEAAIKKSGILERAHEAGVTEALTSIYTIHHQQLVQDWHHWGCNQISNTPNFIQIRFKDGFININGFSPGSCSDGFRVVTSLKPKSIRH